MSSVQPPESPARVEDLLTIERVCDEFEDRIADGQRLSLSDALQQVPAHLRSELCRHLNKITADAATIDPSSNSDRSELPSGVAQLHPGLMLDGYLLEKHLGSGGTATVWHATDVANGNSVAIKIFDRCDPSAMERFRREAETVERLQHPRVVRLLGTGGREEMPYLVTDYVEGHSLAVELKRHPPKPKRAAQLLHEIVQVIVYAHEQGVIHRDLKPHNVLVDQQKHLHLTDFGLAKETSGDPNTLTKTGEILGTPAYMAPEQAGGLGKQADERSDIFSLGVMLFRMLTGDVPFRGSPQSIVYQILHVEATSPRTLQPSVPVDLATICLKCLQKSPDHRFQSAEELGSELKRFLDGKPILSRAPSSFAKARKWAARNPRHAGSLLLSLLLLISISIVSVAAAISKKNALETERQLRTAAQESAIRAEQFAIEAKREAELSRQTQDFLVSIIEASDPIDEILVNNSLPARRPPTVNSILHQAESRIRAELADQPVVQSRLMDTLGNALRAAGMFDQAKDLLTDAAKVRSGITTDEASTRTDRLKNELYQARLAHDVGHRQRAWVSYERVIAKIREQGKAAELDLATALFFFGKLQTEMRENEQAVESFAECLDIRRRRLGSQSISIAATEIALALASGSVQQPFERLMSQNDWAADIASQYFQMCAFRHMKQYPQACEIYAKIVSDLEQRMGSHSLLVLLARGDYAGLRYDAGNYVEADEIIRKVLDQVPASANSHLHVRRARMRLANELQFACRMEEAGEIYNLLAADYSKVEDYSIELTLGLVWTDYARGRTDRLLEYASALTSRRNLMPEQSAWFAYTRARMHDKLGEHDEAKSFDAEALRIAESIEHKLNSPTWLKRVALIHTHNGHPDRAEPLIRQAIRGETRRRFSTHPQVARYKGALANVLEKQGKTEEARELREEVHAIWTASLPETDVRRKNSQKRLSTNAESSTGNDQRS